MHNPKLPNIRTVLLPTVCHHSWHGLSTFFLDVSSLSCASSRSAMMLLGAFFALSSFFSVCSFALSTQVIYLKALSAWTCIMVVLLKLLWPGLKDSELCRSSDVLWCEHHLCDTLPDSDLLLLSDGKVFRLMPLCWGIGMVCWGTIVLLASGSSSLIALFDLQSRGSLSFVDRTRMMGSTTSLSSNSSEDELKETLVFLPLDHVWEELCEWVTTCPSQLGRTM